jgi:hypothetical protein
MKTDHLKSYLRSLSAWVFQRIADSKLNEGLSRCERGCLRAVIDGRVCKLSEGRRTSYVPRETNLALAFDFLILPLVEMSLS